MARIRKDFDDLLKELEETKKKIEEKKQQEAVDIYNFLSKECKVNKLDFEGFKYWFKSLNKEDKKRLKEVREEMKNKNDMKEDLKNEIKEDDMINDEKETYYEDNKFTNN